MAAKGLIKYGVFVNKPFEFDSNVPLATKPDPDVPGKKIFILAIDSKSKLELNQEALELIVSLATAALKA